jgi:hypothetical protein
LENVQLSKAKTSGGLELQDNNTASNQKVFTFSSSFTLLPVLNSSFFLR